MTASRPDLLPFAKYSIFGLPYHGLVKNGNEQGTPKVKGTLTLPSSATMQYTQPYDGGAILVQHPKAAVPTRTAAETASDTENDYQWLPYALLSGRLHQIGGQDLGATKHIYCDENYAWVIRTLLTSGTGTCKLEVFLNKLFGYFSDSDYSFSEIKLAEYQWSPIGYVGQSMASYVVGDDYLATYSKTGAKVILNVGTYAQSGLPLNQSINTQHNESFVLHDAIRITISGNGSIEAGSIGSGISATIASIATAQQMYSSVLTVLQNDSTGYETELTQTSKYLYVCDKNGAETHIEYVFYSLVYIERKPSPPYYPVSTSSTKTGTVTFGGNSYVNSASYTGVFDNTGFDVETGGCPAGYTNAGTQDINGVTSPYCGDESSAYTGTIGNLTVSSRLPQVVIVEADNKARILLTAAGTAASWSEDILTNYYAHNPWDDAVEVNGLQKICYV